jgi:hypothetical protein
MSKAVLLFSETILPPDGVVPGAYATYYYYEDDFWYLNDALTPLGDLDEVSSSVLSVIGHRIDYEEFKSKYNDMKEHYCFEEEVIDSCLREYKLKHLLD